MSKFKEKLPAIIYAIFELVFGILLLKDPEGFTNAIIKIFGGVTLAIGAIYLISYIKHLKQEGEKRYFALFVSIPSIIIGCICLFATSAIQGLVAAIAVIYGVIFLITAVYKLKVYFELKRENMPVSIISMIAAAFSIVLGIIIIINPFSAVNVFWMFVGVSLIVEAILDFLSIILSA